MNPLRRWVRFNVVGVAGMLVQLVTLAGLNHIIPRHYLLNSLIAVETAILHNFVAHVHYTWRDRIVRNAWRDRRARMLLACSLWRFQVSNGAVSLVGNAALMKLLVGVVHMPVLLANLIAIVVCGLANFWVGDNWAFRARSRSGRLLCQGVALVLIVMQVGVAVGQQTAQPAPQAGTAPQQAVPVLSAAAQKIKEDVCRIPDDGKITVRMLDGVVYHGRLDQVEAERFTVREVDLAQIVPIRYADVKSVKANYGGKGFGGRRVDPLRSAIIGAAFVAGLLSLVLVAVASDKS